jgi:hypothetical protein
VSSRETVGDDGGEQRGGDLVAADQAVVAEVPLAGADSLGVSLFAAVVGGLASLEELPDGLRP